MNLFVFLCQLQLYFFTLKGLDLPLKPNQNVTYTKRDRLEFMLSFTNFPKLPNHQTLVSILYLKNPKNKAEIISGPIYHHSKIESHSYIQLLDVDVDGTKIYVKVNNNDNQEFYYEENIVTLYYVNKTIGPNKHPCLKYCRISMDEWIAKPNPYIDLFIYDQKNSNMTSYVSAREKVIINCKGHKLPPNTYTAMYVNDKEYKSVRGGKIKETITINEKDTNSTIYCISLYNDSQKVQSKKYTLLLKEEPKPHKITLITEPNLNNVTYYQSGDRFAYNCTAAENTERMGFSWIHKKDDQLNSSSSFSVIDIVLNESYDQTNIMCNASYMNESKIFDDISVTTTLILNTDYKISTPWWWYIIAILVIIIIAALATVVYCYRKRKPQNYDHVVDVQNELYGQEYAAGLVYAQLYDHRNGAPSPPPPIANRVHYSNVIGYLERNN